METPQLRPVSSPTRCLKSASALSVQRILLPRMVNPRKLSRSCEAQAMSRGRSARVSQRAPPAQGPAAAQRHPLCGQELLDGRPPALAGHAEDAPRGPADRVPGIPALSSGSAMRSRAARLLLMSRCSALRWPGTAVLWRGGANAAMRLREQASSRHLWLDATLDRPPSGAPLGHARKILSL